MKNLNAQWQGVKNYLYKNYGQESGKLIVHTGLITWTMACLSQVFAIVVNDKIPKEQKKFLIPQEFADGAINILAFYTLTNSLKNLSSRLVSTGKWTNKAIRKFVGENPLKEVKLGDISTDLSKTYKGNEDFYKAYSPFKNGVDMIAATIGSIVSCNVVVPILRNMYGAKQQKQSLASENVKKDNISTLTIPAVTPINMGRYQTSSFKSGSMKI